MNVLVILHKDVYNIPTLHVVEEMLVRGYKVDIYAIFMDHNHIRMFENIGIEINDIKELAKEKIEIYDFIYSAVTIEAIPNGMEINKYVFTFSTAYMDDIVNYADFTFTQRDLSKSLLDYNYDIDENNNLKAQPGAVVGNPKFDFELSSDSRVNERQILFIDAGHYPFGRNGKMEEARMLLRIAEENPSYTLIIKPRFLVNDKNVTHKNSLHLYDCIEELSNNNIPSNLIMKKKHVDLEELVRTSTLIITPELTTSYLDIGFYGKKGLIASNLPTEYTLVHNIDHVRRFKKIEKRSGLCVDYREIFHYIPDGLAFNEKHYEEMGLKSKNASKKIVDAMEKIYNKYISNNIYPSPDREQYISFETVKQYRYLKRLFGSYETIKARIEILDFKKVKDKINSIYHSKINLNVNNFDEYVRILSYETRKVILDNKNKLMSNEMMQSYYINALYEENMLQNETVDSYEEKQTYYCLMGKYYAINEKEYDKAINCFEQYFEYLNKKQYENTLSDLPYYEVSACYWIGVSYYELNNESKAEEYFEKCQTLTNNTHKKAAEYLEKIRNSKKYVD